MPSAVQEEGTADGTDLPDGSRLTLQAHAAKDFTLPRPHPGLGFQSLAAAADAPPDSTAPAVPLPDPSSDWLLRRRLPAVRFGAAAASESGPPLVYSAAVEAARRAAMRGPGSYAPPLWLQVRPAAESAEFVDAVPMPQCSHGPLQAVTAISQRLPEFARLHPCACQLADSGRIGSSWDGPWRHCDGITELKAQTFNYINYY